MEEIEKIREEIEKIMGEMRATGSTNAENT
jgi:hypothetical protein